MLAPILAQMNEQAQAYNDEPFTIEDAQQHVTDYNAWVDSITQESACEHLAKLGGDFQCADCFARSKGFTDASHLSGMAELIESVYQMKQLEKEIAQCDANLKRLERDAIVARHGLEARHED